MRDRKTVIILLLAVVVSTALFYDVHVQRTFDLSKLRALYISSAAVLAFWAIGTHRVRLYWKDDLIITIFLMLATGLVSAVLAINTRFSFYGCAHRCDGFLQFCVYVFLFFAVINFIERRHLDHVFTAIIACACVASIYSIFQKHGIDFWTWSSFGEGSNLRPISTFGHPAFFAAWLITMIPLVLYKIFVRNVFWLIPLALILVALNHTQTRACFVGLAVSCAFFFWFNRSALLARRKKIILAGLGLIVATTIFVGATSKNNTVVKRFKDEFSTQGFLHGRGSFFTRIISYKVAMLVIRDYPYWGIGQDCLVIKCQKYLADVYSREKTRRTFYGDSGRAHCWPLDIAQHRGLIGLAAFLLFVYAFGKMVWRHCRRGDILVITLTSGCIAYAVQNLFSFGHIPIITLFWFFVGMTFVACKGKTYLTQDRIF